MSLSQRLPTKPVLDLSVEDGLSFRAAHANDRLQHPMYDEDTIREIVSFLTAIEEPRTAFGLWLSLTGVLAGSYFLPPLLVVE